MTAPTVLSSSMETITHCDDPPVRIPARHSCMTCSRATRRKKNAQPASASVERFYRVLPGAAGFYKVLGCPGSAGFAALYDSAASTRLDGVLDGWSSWRQEFVDSLRRGPARSSLRTGEEARTRWS